MNGRKAINAQPDLLSSFLFLSSPITTTTEYNITRYALLAASQTQREKALTSTLIPASTVTRAAMLGTTPAAFPPPLLPLLVLPLCLSFPECPLEVANTLGSMVAELIYHRVQAFVNEPRKKTRGRPLTDLV